MERHVQWRWVQSQRAKRAQHSAPQHSIRRCRSRARSWLVGTAFASLVVCAAALIGRSILESHIRNRVLPALAERFGRDIEADDISIAFGTATLRGITVRGPSDGATPLAHVDSATVSVDLSSLLHGDIAVKHIELRGVVANLIVGAGENDNTSDFLSRLASPGQGASTGAGIGRARLADVTLSAHDISIILTEESTQTESQVKAKRLDVDAQRTLRMSGVELAGQTEFRGQRASVNLSGANVRVMSDGSVFLKAGGMRTASSDPRLTTVLENNSVGTIYFERVHGQSRGWEWNVMGDFPGGLESFLISFSKTSSGINELRVQGKNVQLARFAPLLAAYPGLDVEQGAASIEWTVLLDEDYVSVHGETLLDGIKLSHPRIAHNDIHIAATRLKGRASLHRRTGTLRIDDAVIESGGVPYNLSAGALLPGFARAVHPEASLIARLAMPEVGCQDMLASIPSGFAPELEEFALAGRVKGDVSIAIDWANLDTTTLRSSVDLDGCRVTSAPMHMSAERLSGSFAHRVPVPDGWRTFLIGPANKNFVPLRKVSKNLTRSFLTTEDSGFFRHKGFIAKEFRSALIKNLKRKRFAYGASSISMQVVKNVLLGREKTMSRKVQELFLTWHLESVLSKDRILEIYVNAIEFGPGLYGIGPASRQYFGKHPRNLNPVESAFLSSLLPAPTKRFRQYCRGRVGRTTSAKIERILGHMHKRHRLDEEEHALALATPLAFRGRKSALCKRSNLSKKGKNS